MQNTNHNLQVSERALWKSFPLPPYFPPHRSEHVVGNNGAGGAYPPGTLSSFHAAWDAGCRVFAVRLETTSDGIVVCFPYETLDQITNLNGNISDYPWDSLRTGAVVHGAHGKRDSLAQFEDILEEFPHAEFVAEVPHARVASPLIKLINRRLDAGRLCIWGNSDTVLEEIRHRTSPILQRALGNETFAEFARLAREGLSADPALKVGNWVHIPYRIGSEVYTQDPMFTRLAVGLAHDLGMGVRTFTINDFNTVQRLWNQSVDAVVTDFPEQTLKMWEAREQQQRTGLILG